MSYLHIKRATSLALSLVALVASLAPAVRGQDVIINEIMYHPVSENLLEDYVELYNRGTNVVNLTGWKMTSPASFSFPSNTVLNVGAYLVVVADMPTFTAKYPTVTNKVGGWTGHLSFGGDIVTFEDGASNIMDTVTYYNDGDWAVRQIGAVMYNHQGWEWFVEHDGLGKSAELINPLMSNQTGENWGSSTNLNGTPGQPNSIARTNIAPLITEVGHLPVIPQPSDTVLITARITDEHTNGLTVTLNWRVDGAASFTTNTMFDDGAHGDGLAGDGIFGASIPPQANNTVVEFLVQAKDLENNLRTYPNFIQPTNSTRTANLLYQVDSQVYSGSQPLYRIIMREIERAELYTLGRNCPNSDSDAEMNATWITQDAVLTGGTTTQLRYNCGARNRGHGSRQSNPNNYHINIPSDRLWKNQSGINLNSQYAFSHAIGSAVFRLLEVPMADSRPVQVRVNSTNLMVTVGGNSFGSYAANEQYNSDFVKRSFPTDKHGNSYRGIRSAALCDPIYSGSVADLTWHGANYAQAIYTNTYFKQNNRTQNDWSDLIDLLAVLNTQNGHVAGNYVADVYARMNVEEWMAYMAINTLIDNDETALSNGVGDDYALYRGTNDTRFLALSYDMDTVMGQGLTATPPQHSIFRMTALAAMDRFMKTPEFSAVYYRWLKTLADTTFSPAQMNVLLDQILGGYVPAGTLSTIKAYNAAQVSYVLSQIPLTLNVSNSLTVVSGYPRSTTATVALNGLANAIDTRTILVNGVTSSWTAWRGTWTNNSVALLPGINHITVQSLNSNGVAFASTNVDIWYDTGVPVNVSGTLGVNMVWTPAGGPYNINANLIVPAGVTLTIQAGTTVYVASGVTITVNGTGTILAQGTAAKHIRIGKQPAAAGNWGSLDFINTTTESQLAFVDFDSGGGTTIGGHNAQIHVNNGIVFFDHLTWPESGLPAVEYISTDSASFTFQGCVFPSYPSPGLTAGRSQPELLHGLGGIMAGGHGIARDCYFGHSYGFNDTWDYTGGTRPGPILQIINNIFDGASDDCLDLDSTDAWIEGNIFMHVHRDPYRNDQAIDTGSAISGGVDFINTNSSWTIINNLFYDVDHVFMNKGNSTTTPNGGGRVAFLYNTVAHVAKEYSGTSVPEIAVFDWSDDNVITPSPSVGSGVYVAQNIFVDAPSFQRFYYPTSQTVILDNNIFWQTAGVTVMPDGSIQAVNNPVANTNQFVGSQNKIVDPLLNLDALLGIQPTNVTPAQLLQAFKLKLGSPAIGAGFGGRNIGGLNTNGIAISGEPRGTTTVNSATLTVGPAGTFNWGTTPPQRWGWMAYKWNLDNGAWSPEITVTNNSPFTNPPTITLSNLSNGPHTVYVVGRNDAGPGYYQDDTFVYPASAGIAARVTASRTWIVNTNFAHVRLNEVLAKNNTILTNGLATPDLIELFNDGSTTIDLSGMGLTDTTNSHYNFTFPAATTLASGAYLVLYADSLTGGPFLHTGFGFKPSGADLFLYDRTNNGGGLLDSVSFGVQLPDFSIGRTADGSWGLCKPTFGAANSPVLIGDPRHLKINEWLADAQFADDNDFIELYNPDPVPVALGGLFLSNASGSPGLNRIPDLSFIAAGGFTKFTADNNPAQGADHVSFKLSPDVGLILLSAADLSTIDAVLYGPQTTDISQGRSPNGSVAFTFFTLPTPGAANPGSASITAIITTNSSVVVTTNTAPPVFVSLTNLWKVWTNGTDQGTAWRVNAFDDSTWSSGLALFYHGNAAGSMPFPPNTIVPFTSPTIQNTFYFRTHFTVTNANPTSLTLTSSNVIDDGLVMYVNNQEAYRQNMPAGTVTNATPASISINIATLQGPFTIPATNLVTGDNVMALEVHQISAASSDIAMSVSLVCSSCAGVTTISTNTVITVTTNFVTNSIASAPVVLNEILARNVTITNNSGAISDWVELFNPTTNAVDLSDMSLTDNTGDPRRWVFPAGTVLQSNAYRVIYFDDMAPVSPTNTGFTLSARSGGGVFLFDKVVNGGGLVDGVNYGVQAADFSIGRIPNGSGVWALNVPTRGAINVAAGLGPISALKVNEWLADESSGSDWFELYNSSAQPVSLAGLFLTDDLLNKTKSPVPPLSFIGTGGRGFVQFFADNSTHLGADHVAFKLGKSGSAIGIFSGSGAQIDAVIFGAQVKDVSQGRFPDGVANIVSFPDSSSPGDPNWLPLANLVINEALSHTDPPLEDAIELLNTNAATVDISGWYLSDSTLNFKKYPVPAATTIPPGAFKVFYETQFNNTALAPNNFQLSSAYGDDLWLSAAVGGNLTGYRAHVKFGAGQNGVSFGRYVNSAGKEEFVAQSQRTFGVDSPATLAQFRTGTGKTNVYPSVGPIVVSEIMYQPPLLAGQDNQRDEFIELLNITGTNVVLYDPAFPTNTWHVRGGIVFDFPTNKSLAAGARVLVVSFDPFTNSASLAAFRSAYGLGTNVIIYGPYTGKLNNGGDSVELYKPDPPQPAGLPDAGFTPFVLVEKIVYDSKAPWITNVFANGNSLQRVSATGFGDDPTNWIAAAASPGGVPGLIDTDGDGMPDAWEIANGLNPNFNDAGLDPDGDGMTNLQEYLAGTDPHSFNSSLRLFSLTTGGSNFVFSFVAVSNKTYTVQYRNSLATGAWLRLQDVSAAPFNRQWSVTNAPGATRFYQAVTPTAP